MKLRALTEADLPLGGRVETAGTTWLLAAQAKRWQDLFPVFRLPFTFTVFCHGHRDKHPVARGGWVDLQPHLVESGESIRGLVAVQGRLAIPPDGEHRMAVDLARESRARTGGRSRADSQLRWVEDASYVVILNDQGVPGTLPFACPRCGRVEVSLPQLRRWADGPTGSVYRVPSMPG